MRTRAPGSPCKLYVDGLPNLKPGDYITTRAGSAYFVQAMRQSPTRPERRYLDCIRWCVEEIPADATRWTLVWYSRGSRSKAKRVHQG